MAKKRVSKFRKLLCFIGWGHGWEHIYGTPPKCEYCGTQREARWL